jgi:predicted nucleic acid-binding protein
VALAVVLADASALVASLDASDRHHAACQGTLRSLRGGLLTVCAAFAESMYVLGSRRGWDGQRALWQLLERDVLRIAPDPEWLATAELMARYRDVPMALAGAQLVLVATELVEPIVFTLDSDFYVYRLPDGRAPRVVP